MSNITENLTVKFVNAEVTNTRLMGALGLYVHWEVSDSTGESLRLRQFIRYDVDLAGIEFLAFARDDDHQRLKDLLHEYFGSLGGEMVKLNERQTRFLGNYFIDQTLRSGHEIPDDVMQIDFFSSQPVTLTGEEKKELMEKICVSCENNYGLVNYFLMRSFAKDDEARLFLSCNGDPENSHMDVSFPTPGELIRNNIESFGDQEGAGSSGHPVVTYLCESTVSIKHDNYLVLTEVQVDAKDHKVVSVKKNLTQKMSHYESAVVINRPEYIACFDMISNDKALRRVITALCGSAMVFEHDAGDLYMVMHDNNDHVNKPVYRLNDDVRVIFFITNAEQLLVVSNTDLVSCGALETLAPYIAADNIIEVGNYYMETPVFFDFIDSEYDDFEEFLEDMQPE